MLFSGGDGGTWTHVLLGCQDTFYILILSTVLKIATRVNTLCNSQKADTPIRTPPDPYKSFPSDWRRNPRRRINRARRFVIKRSYAARAYCALLSAFKFRWNVVTQSFRLRYAYTFAHRQSNPKHPLLLPQKFFSRTIYYTPFFYFCNIFIPIDLIRWA